MGHACLQRQTRRRVGTGISCAWESLAQWCGGKNRSHTPCFCLGLGSHRARAEQRERAKMHLQAGNEAAALECYQRAVDVSPSMAKQVIEVRGRGWGQKEQSWLLPHTLCLQCSQYRPLKYMVFASLWHRTRQMHRWPTWLCLARCTLWSQRTQTCWPMAAPGYAASAGTVAVGVTGPQRGPGILMCGAICGATHCGVCSAILTCASSTQGAVQARPIWQR